MPISESIKQKIHKIISIYEQMLNLARSSVGDPELSLFVLEAYRRLLKDQLPIDFQNKKNILHSVEESIKFHEYLMLDYDSIVKSLIMLPDSTNFIVAPIEITGHVMALIVRRINGVFNCEVINGTLTGMTRYVFEKKNSLELAEIVYELSYIREKGSEGEQSTQRRSEDDVYKVFGGTPKSISSTKSHFQKVHNCLIKGPEFSLIAVLEKCGITKDKFDFIKPENRYRIIKEIFKNILSEQCPGINLDEAYTKLDKIYEIYYKNKVFVREIRGYIGGGQQESLLIYGKEILGRVFEINISKKTEVMKALGMLAYTTVFKGIPEHDGIGIRHPIIYELFKYIDVDLKKIVIMPVSSEEIKNLCGFFDEICKMVDSFESVLPQLSKQLREESAGIAELFALKMDTPNLGYMQIKWITKAIELCPSISGLLHANRGILKQRSFDIEGSIEDFTTAIATFKGTADNPRDCNIYLHRAMSRIALNDLNGAIEDARKFISLRQRGEGLERAYLVCAKAESDRGNFKQALRDAQKSLEYDSSNGRTYIICTIASYNLGEFQKAIEYASKAIYLLIDKNEIELIYGIKLKAGHMLMAECTRYVNVEEFKKDLETIKKINPDSQYLKTITPTIETLIEDYKKKMRGFFGEDISRLSTKNLAIQYNGQGAEAFRADKYMEAVAFFSKTISMFPQDETAHNNRGAARGKVKGL